MNISWWAPTMATKWTDGIRETQARRGLTRTQRDAESLSRNRVPETVDVEDPCRTWRVSFFSALVGRTPKRKSLPQ